MNRLGFWRGEVRNYSLGLMFCIDLRPNVIVGSLSESCINLFRLACSTCLTTGDLSSNLPSMSVKSLLCMYTKQANV